MNDPTKNTTMQNPEWVQETDWTKVQPGNTVRLTNDDGAEVTIIIRDRRDPFARNTEQWVVSRTGTTYLARDWRMFVQAPPKVVLPKATVMFRNNFVATWRAESLSWSITGYERAWGDPEEILRTFGSDFTILEPVVETAQKVLDRIDGWYALGEKRTLIQYLAALRAELGVTS